MVWFGIFVVLGGASYALSRALTPMVLVFAAIGVLLSQIGAVILAVSRGIGLLPIVDSVMNDLSNYQGSPCSPVSLLGALIALLYLVLIAVPVLLVYAGLVALAVGAVMAAAGAVTALVPRANGRLLIAGLGTAAAGAGAIVVSGLLLRILNELAAAGVMCV